MDVPTSFDYRGSQVGVRALKHLQLVGVTNAKKNDQHSNWVVESTNTAHGRVSSLRDEDNLNQHWQQLLL